MKKFLAALLCGLYLFSLPAALAAEEDEVAGTAEVTEAVETTDPTEVTGPAETAGEVGYPDVPADEWYAADVTRVTQLGLMKGSDDGLFHPNDPVSRAAVILVLWRMEGCPAPQAADWAENPAFPDVDGADPLSPSYWYAEAAAWAKEAGIASGYEDGSFLGMRSVTREELALFLYRYAAHKGQPQAKGLLTLFPDADKVSDWAEDALCHAVGMGLLQGNELGELNPQGVALRCQLAAILVRMDTPVAG